MSVVMFSKIYFFILFIWQIWIQPEATRPLAPLLRNLQMLRLRFIHEKCDLSWTMFILEAAPLLKEINIQVHFFLIAPNIFC
jgi:hypothetical protein